jgi:hypothetical protein
MRQLASRDDAARQREAPHRVSGRCSGYRPTDADGLTPTHDQRHCAAVDEQRGGGGLGRDVSAPDGCRDADWDVGQTAQRG